MLFTNDPGLAGTIERLLVRNGYSVLIAGSMSGLHLHDGNPPSWLSLIVGWTSLSNSAITQGSGPFLLLPFFRLSINSPRKIISTTLKKDLISYFVPIGTVS